MSFFSVVKVEFVKLLRKRISFLLLLFFAPAILFGVGMSLGLSFFVADGGGGGVDAVAKSLSGIGFAVNMMEQGKYIVFLVTIILAAFSLSSELENGQIKSELIRVCSRSKIVSAKYLSLFLLITGTFLLSLLWQLLIYAVFVSKTEFASGMLFDELLWAQIGYIGFTLLGIGNGLAVTFLLGMKLKTFPYFSVSYIVWFASQYTDFMGKIKLFIPYNMPSYFLEKAGETINGFAYAGLYLGYCMVFLVLSVILLRASDIKA